MSNQRDLNIFKPTIIQDSSTALTVGQSTTQAIELENDLGFLISVMCYDYDVGAGTSAQFIAEVSRDNSTWTPASNITVAFDNVSADKNKRIWSFSSAGPLAKYLRVKIVVAGTVTTLGATIVLHEETKVTELSDQNPR